MYVIRHKIAGQMLRKFVARGFFYMHIASVDKVAGVKFAIKAAEILYAHFKNVSQQCKSRAETSTILVPHEVSPVCAL
jgi:hypothetical protein